MLNDLKKAFQNTLNPIYGYDEVESLFYLVTEFYLNVSRLQYALNPNTKVLKSDVKRIESVLHRLKQHEPIQYILGETEFYGLKFKVNSAVLIPRQETEELVSLIVENFKNLKPNSKAQKPIRILDIGTGSGCIAISLAKHLPNAKVYAVDVSKEALKVAEENAKLNNVAIEFMAYDILNPSDTNFFLFDKNVSKHQKGLFDIIVSNPPYVRDIEKKDIKPNVLNNEPHLALFVDDDNPLIFYKAITNFARHYLKPYGYLYFEINQYLGEVTKQVLLDANFKAVELLKDLNGNDRLLLGKVRS